MHVFVTMAAPTWTALDNKSKAPSTPVTISKQRSTLSTQHSTLLPKTATCNVERNFVLSTKWKQTEHVQFVSILSNDKISFDIVAVTGNNVEATFDL